MSTEVRGTEGTGNTKAVPSARAWQLTLNEVDRYSELLAGLQSYKTLDYLISCKEQAPSTGHEHIHVYAHFRHAVRLPLKKTAGAHVERCRGSPKQNIAYIEKGGEILDELGERPRQGARSVKDLLAVEHEEDLEDYREYNTWLKLKQRPKKIQLAEWHKEVEVVYITGPSGSGKTQGAKQLLEQKGVSEIEEVKCIGEFWHGVVDGTGAAVYDEFRGSDLKAREFLNFIDYNTHTLNVKGGSVVNRYSIIVITSVERPEELYRNLPQEAREQWMRRMRVVNLYPDDGDLADLE